MQFRRRLVQTIGRHLGGRILGFAQMERQRCVGMQLRRGDRQARFGLQPLVLFRTRRQHVLMAVQLGHQMPCPALRFPAIAPRSQLGFVEDQGQ